MREIWNQIIRRYNKLITWREEFIRQGQKQMASWLDKPPCWIRAIAFVFILLIAVPLGCLIIFFYSANPVSAIGLGGLIISSIGIYLLNRRTIASEQGLTVERLTHAMQQLENKKVFIRLGGILGLEQIAISQKEESKKIARILVSFIRTQATLEPELAPIHRMQRLDVEAAVNALARIASKLEKQKQFRAQYNEQKHDLCDLNNIDLKGLRFVETDLSQFDLTGTDFSGAWLTGANLQGAHLYSCSIGQEPESKAKFTEAFMNGANLSNVFLSSVDFSEAHMVGVNFSCSMLHNAIFIDANLGKANLNSTDLRGANFTKACLRMANISNADMKSVNLHDADLRSANLSKSKLISADCNSTYLREAILVETNISGSLLSNSRVLTQEQIDKTFYWERYPPTLPQGFKLPSKRKHPEDGFSI